MAIKGGLPKASLATSREEREAFIGGAPGKVTYPWQEPRVRDDLMVQVNVKQPERQGDRISNLSEDFGEICVLPSRPLDLDAQGAL
jgi:hypothetical protein